MVWSGSRSNTITTTTFTCLVLAPELVLHEGQAAQLPGQFERREDGVLGGEGDEGGRGQCSVGVDATTTVTQRVVVTRRDAVLAAAPGAVLWRLRQSLSF